jgi:ankyrin repeat protein
VAARKGYLEVVKLLVEMGAVVDHANVEVADYLLSAGVNINHLNAQGMPYMLLLREVISMSSSSW